MSDYSVINVKKKTIMRREKRKEFDVSDIENQNGKTITKKKRKEKQKREKKRKEKRQWNYKSPTASKTYKTC